MDEERLACPICKTKSSVLDVVDFNKSCEELRGKYLPSAGIPVAYALCSSCYFCWAPELYEWPLAKFKEWIYNGDYVAVDPDYIEARPKGNADALRSIFPSLPSTVRHLDYGGGNGLLARSLRESNWDSVSYDPLLDASSSPEQVGQFALITAFEVFEHVPDTRALVSDLWSLLSSPGLVLFSTLLSDGNIQPNQKLTWWYASPRNGHISLFSRTSLYLLAQNGGFRFGSLSANFHFLAKGSPPQWASHLIPTG